MNFSSVFFFSFNNNPRSLKERFALNILLIVSLPAGKCNGTCSKIHWIFISLAQTGPCCPSKTVKLEIRQKSTKEFRAEKNWYFLCKKKSSLTNTGDFVWFNFCLNSCGGETIFVSSLRSSLELELFVRCVKNWMLWPLNSPVLYAYYHSHPVLPEDWLAERRRSPIAMCRRQRNSTQNANQVNEHSSCGAAVFFFSLLFAALLCFCFCRSFVSSLGNTSCWVRRSVN